ncbi:ABC transporter permease subunit [Neorhizobium galegae]|uniref:ABC transporter permease subunit n=1 Tax=Neorhizobium galegae TaxID=399 RepID=UPI0006225B81|nr:ABC transporter permease subunit [Neorhizobium galegae]CDZ28080.1 Glycerol-3-phosphate transporter membrane protein [Neorhizobium galegae bv. officinalis]KAA9386887.1 ABC transporter permease subunit [Neorhizobium galegae]KAB1116027.1 ABC transporter permease subunit [Neorhizobium galegae]MCM2498028.1 ABC transporter permease subunit [Neorhizobium galegae]MCQ1774072.1 ABC transporter permease subunit [Neorhizobium galegae]
MIENARSLNIAASLILLVGMLYILGPLYLTLATASQSYEFLLRNGLAWYPGDQFLNNAARIFTETRIPIQMLNSLAVAFSLAIATCILSFLSAYAIVYFRIRWAGVAFALILATIMLPVDIRVITTYQVASNVFSPVNALLDVSGLNGLIAQVFGAPVQLELSVLNTHFGLIAPLAAHGTGTFLFRQFFRTLPGDLFKAARMDGAGPVRFMFDILLPLSRTSFAALFVLTFLSGWTQYLWPLVASSTPDMQTAVVGLARLLPDSDGEVPDFPMIMAGAVIVSLVPLLMIALLQRYLVQGLVLSEK